MTEQKRPTLNCSALLKWAREGVGLSWAELGNLLGIGGTFLAACEAGQERLTFAQLTKLAAVCLRSVAALYLPDLPPAPEPATMQEAALALQIVCARRAKFHAEQYDLPTRCLPQITRRLYEAAIGEARTAMEDAAEGKQS